MSVQSISTSLPAHSHPEAVAMSRQATAQAVKAMPEPAAQPVAREELRAAVQSVREYIEPIHSGLEFSISDDTHEVVIKVVDSKTKEVIRQIPSEEMMAIAKALDSLKGLLIKQKA